MSKTAALLAVFGLAACGDDAPAMPDAGVDLAPYVGIWDITYDRGACGGGEVVTLRIESAGAGELVIDWPNEASVELEADVEPIHLGLEDLDADEIYDFLLTPVDLTMQPAGPATARVKWEGDVGGNRCVMPDYVDGTVEWSEI